MHTMYIGLMHLNIVCILCAQPRGPSGSAGRLSHSRPTWRSTQSATRLAKTDGQLLMKVQEGPDRQMVGALPELALESESELANRIHSCLCGWQMLFSKPPC